MLRWMIILFLAITCTGSPGFAFDTGAAAALFQKHCSACHHVDRALKKHKDRAGWEKTVTRMKGYAGGQISDQAAETITEYLARIRGPKN